MSTRGRVPPSLKSRRCCIDEVTNHQLIDPTSTTLQSEWRVLVDPTDDEILWLDLGGLEDISQLVSTLEINAGMNSRCRPKRSQGGLGVDKRAEVAFRRPGLR